MGNPLDDEGGQFFVLINDAGRHSLWPAFAPVPSGWRQVHGMDARAGCLVYINENWQDLRPAAVSAYLQVAGAADRPLDIATSGFPQGGHAHE